MAQVSPVRGIPVVFDILSARRIRQPVLESRARCRGRGTLDAVDGVGLALEHACDGWFGVVAGGDFAAGGFDGGDCRGRGAADDNVDGSGEGLGAASEQLDAVFGAVDAARGGQLFDGDGFVGVQTAGVDPGLQAVDVERCHVDRETESCKSFCLSQSSGFGACVLVLKASYTVDDLFGRLTSIEVAWHLAVSLLTLVTAS